jgi:hypothetical protein
MDPLFNHIRNYPQVMDAPYHTLLQSSRQSSSSILGERRKYRDFIFDNSFNDIVSYLKINGVTYALVAGTRSDRRGKYRLICSNDARIRILDHMLNYGSYEIFDAKHGFARNNSCEGLSLSEMYPIMRQMITRDDIISACTDYEGYDGQFGPNDYARLTYELNYHRRTDSDINEGLVILMDFLTQPKILVDASNSNIGDAVADPLYSDHYRTVLPFYLTLPSGLKGTHSHENM